MRRFVFIAEIFDSFSNDLKKFRKFDRRQLFHDFEKNVSFNKSLFSSKQLIIENFFEN